MDVYHSSVVGDNLDRIKGAVNTALDRSDLILITGGLGPTFDDITREGIAASIQRELVYDSQVMAEIEEHFRQVDHPILPIQHDGGGQLRPLPADAGAAVADVRKSDREGSNGN